MKVLVINCGSSSLKYQLIDSQSEEVLAKGLCERIGIEGSSVTHQKAGEGKKTEAVLMKDSYRCSKGCDREADRSGRGRDRISEGN